MSTPFFRYLTPLFLHFALLYRLRVMQCGRGGIQTAINDPKVGITSTLLLIQAQLTEKNEGV